MFKKKWALLFTVIIITVDLIMLNFSFIFSVYLRFLTFLNPIDYWQPWLFINVTFLLLAVVLGIYRNIFQTSLIKQKFYLKKFPYYLALITIFYLFILKENRYSRGVILIFLFAQYILLNLGHSLMFKLNRKMVKKGFGNKTALIVGANKSAYIFYNDLRIGYGNYYKIIGFTNDGHSEIDDPKLEPYLIGKNEQIEVLINKYKIEQVFIVSDSISLRKYEKVRIVCEKNNISLKMVSPNISKLIQDNNIKDVVGIQLNTLKYTYYYKKGQAVLKRMFDLSVVAIAGLILLPLSLLIALGIKLTSKGNIFFKQERSLYKNGPSFIFYKFRTMYENAEDMKDILLNKNETNGALFKMKKDPRITPFGRFLRKFSLDEIPQFINVLHNEMSIVGPRPLPVKDFNMIQNGKVNYDWHTKRGMVKSGITGLWQISGRSNLDFEQMCMLDLYYIENQSIFFDLEIFFKTIPVIIFNRGAY